ncbi:hypothetical protein ACB265_13020 [Aeromonas dhakensis]
MNKQTKILLWSSFLVLLLPILAYMYRFGLGLWEMPNEWADLGSYVGGIYTPILSLITLAVISVQIFIQNQQFQHSLIQHQEGQIKEYLAALEDALDMDTGDGSSRDFLVDMLKDVSKEDVKNIPIELVMNFNQFNHRIYSMWSEVIKCLVILERISNQNLYNKVVFSSNKNKIIAYLNPQSCRMLDRYHYVFITKCQELGLPFDVNPACKYYYSDLNARAQGL